MTTDTFRVGDRVRLVELDLKYHSQLNPSHEVETMKELVGKTGVLEEGEYQASPGEYDVFLVSFDLRGQAHSIDFLRKELRKV